MVKAAWLLSVFLTVVAVSISASGAANVRDGQFGQIRFKKTHDTFWNYDFGSRVSAEGNPPNPFDVDWAMSLLFRNGASKDRVHHLLHSIGNDGQGYDEKGGHFYGAVNDGQGYGKADHERGRKGQCPAIGQITNHYRVYADANGHMRSKYRPDLGHYVIGSIHKDHFECHNPFGFDKWSGDSEEAEKELAKDLIRAWGPRHVNYKWGYWENPEGWPVGWDNNGHHWHNDGWASNFKLP